MRPTKNLFLIITLTSLNFLLACTSVLGLVPEPTATSVPTQTAQPLAVVSTTAPIPTQTATAKCTARLGSLESEEIVTDKIDKPMRILVYLPPCYSADKTKRYPVIYLLHGQNYTEEQWNRIGAKDEADKLISSGKVAPFIMVFPYDFSYKQPTQYAFEEVFISLLIPEIDQAYRTKTGRSDRAIGGISRGGAWALHIGIRNYALFGSIGGHSPAIFFADHKNLPENLLAIPKDQLPRLWLDISVSDKELDLIKEFEQLLTNNRLPHEWNINPGYHEEKYWAQHVEEYLLWYTQNW